MRLGARSRCVHCRMQVELCLCAEIVPMASRTRFVLVMHYEESYKPTNSGFLVQALLPETDVRIRGLRDRPVDSAGLEGAAVLFPSGEAEVLSASSAPPTLIVPDATWRQARRMVRREPALRGKRHVTLPPGPPSEFRIRRHQDRRSLSTLEAVARALVVLGEGDVSRALMRVFRMMVSRILWSRGQLRAEEVYGGLPSGATGP